MINTSELCREYAKAYGVSIKYSESVVNSVFDLMAQLLYENKENIQVRKFGTFKHKTMKQKVFRHPGTGKLMTRPERDVVKFIPSETITEEYKTRMCPECGYTEDKDDNAALNLMSYED